MRRKGKKLAQVARCQARGLLDIPGSEDDHEQTDAVDESLAAWGLCLAPDGDDEDNPPSDSISDGAGRTAGPQCFLWPCNLPTFNAWQRLQTQWTHDASGKPTGLPNERVMPFLERVLRLKPKPFAEMFEALQAMELAALEVWREQRQD